MTSTRFAARSLAAVVLLCAAAASQAAIVSFTSRTAFVGGSNVQVDSLSDLTINTALGVSSLTRSTGSFGYSVSTDNDFYVVPAAGSIALSTQETSDSLVFADFTSIGAVMAFGANFFGTNNLGESASGGLTIVATDLNGFSSTISLPGNSLNGFAGFRSDVALLSVSARMTTPALFGDANPVYVTADNITFVPEPSSLMLVLAAGFAIPLVRARRRA